jgi:6,7-dimethyl-8-ribityllumazine synthase
VKQYAASGDASRLRFGVVVSRFNHLVSVRLLEACTRELEKRGADPADIHVAWVPGAFEIPLAARALAQSGRYDAVVTLGAVIRGGTPHFDYVCRGVADGVREVMRDTSVPVAFGVLTTDDVEQALARAGGSEGNKGEEAALAAIEMARLIVQLSEPPGESTGGEGPLSEGTAS